MDRLEIEKQVNQMFHQSFEIPLEKLQPDATLFEELELDSLDAVDMLVYLEDKFGVKLDGDHFKDIRKLSDVYAMVGKLAKNLPLKH